MAVPLLLEDRIRDLCAQAVSADDSEAEVILAELRFVLREQMRFARAMSAATLGRELRVCSQNPLSATESCPSASRK